MKSKRASTLLVLSLAVLAWGRPLEVGAQVELLPTPGFSKALEKGERQMDLGMYAAAIKSLRKAEELSVKPSTRVLLNLSICSFHLGESEDAEKYARASLSAASAPMEQASAYNMLGLSLLSNADQTSAGLQEAEQAFRTVLELSGSADVARFNLAQALYLQGRGDDALLVLGELIRRSPDGPHVAEALELKSRIEGRPDFEDGLDVARRVEQSQVDYEACVASLHSSPEPLEGRVQPPVRTFSLQPHYTPRARRSGIQGVVILEAVVDEKGHVVCVGLLKGLPMGLDLAAVDVVRMWEYEPATLDGRPVPVHFTFTISFSLTGGDKK